MLRVVGTDPGTGSLDLLLLVDGQVAGQSSLDPEALRARPDALAKLLRQWRPIDLIAGPSGYGLPLVRGEDLREADIDRMALVRPDQRGQDAGVIGFRGWVREVLKSGWPSVFLPGGIHLGSIPDHRKANAIDLGTADKVAVAALACWADRHATPSPARSFAVVEIGSAFTAVLVVEGGKIVDAAAGSRGPIGMKSGGAWDGEAAYWLGPLTKADLFRGGVRDLGDIGPAAFRESLVKHVAGLRAVTPFDRIYLSGSAVAGLGAGNDLRRLVTTALTPFGEIRRLSGLPGAWVKSAAQGAALLADGLAGGRHADLVEALDLRSASGTIGDSLRIRPTDPS
ncbi:DUF1464 family protein [Tundrisphaera sp. TA3]|uniref:DUF1464 family protein n=1 Tax=Tundrisphaera sp. TA3 TaxID=3435775 RepID=UPI003EB98A54